MEPAASAMGDQDPIAAIATGAGVGRRAAVRISGFGGVEAIADKVGGDARRLVDPPCRGIVPGPGHSMEVGNSRSSSWSHRAPTPSPART